MEAMAEFFEWINSLLGVSTPSELVFHPVFLTVCAILFVLGVVKGWKTLSLPILGLLGGAAIFYYLYPKNSSDLLQLVKFVGAMGVLSMFIIYIGFIRE